MDRLVKFLFPLFFPVTEGEGIGTVTDLSALQDKENDEKGSDRKIEGNKEGKEEDNKDDDSGDEDKESEETTEEEDKDEDEEESEDEELEEDKEVEEDEKELDLVTRASDIKKAYPDFFKKFPDVRAAIYRDIQFSQYFASPQDAQVAAERADVLGRIEQDIINDGNPDK